MGFIYRKSARLGPFRVHLSRSGVGWSVGAGGFRAGVSARGRRYSTVSLPGTGVSYRTSGERGGLGKVLFWVGLGIGGLAWALGSRWFGGR